MKLSFNYILKVCLCQIEKDPCRVLLALRAGFEPATKWLTATRSTPELPQNITFSSNSLSLFLNFGKRYQSISIFEYLFTLIARAIAITPLAMRRVATR